MTGPLVVAPAGEAAGCAATDYAGLPVKGAVSAGDDSKIPVLSVSKSIGSQLKSQPGDATVLIDSNYHSPDDTIANVNRDALAKTGRVVGYVTALYAQDQSGRNGVPVPEDRTPTSLPWSDPVGAEADSMRA